MGGQKVIKKIVHLQGKEVFYIYVCNTPKKLKWAMCISKCVDVYVTS